MAWPTSKRAKSNEAEEGVAPLVAYPNTGGVKKDAGDESRQGRRGRGEAPERVWPKHWRLRRHPYIGIAGPARVYPASRAFLMRRHKQCVEKP
jgi:hypothetical protein